MLLRPAAGAIALAGLTWAGATSPALADRYTFRVIGVEQGDTLNLRARVTSLDKVSETRILARIPPSTGGLVGTGATQKVGSIRWYEVRYGTTLGWANGRYLAPMSSTLGDALTSNLFCAGADPFWSLRIEREKAELREPAAEPRTLGVFGRDAAKAGAEQITMTLSGQNGARVDVRHAEWCKDGISPLEYGFEARVVPDVGPRALRGCCSLLR